MLCAYLRDAGNSVAAASDTIQAIDCFHQENWDLILLEQLWNYDFICDERFVDSHIKNLRKKLNRDYIETNRGGYRVEKIH